MSSMAFACDPQPADAAWLLLGAAQTPSAAGRHWLLVDMALLDVQRVNEILSPSRWTVVNTLATSRYAKFGQFAPQMVQLPSDLALAKERLARLLGIDRTSPALSLFTSPQPPEVLQQLFGYLASARVDDDLDLYCRFADTRVLPALLAALDPAQRQRVSQAVGNWHWLDRRGQLADWSAPAADEAAAAAPDQHPTIQLSASQFDAMLKASEADAMFTLLHDTTPELVPDDQRGQFHQRLCQFLATAAEHGVTAPRDQLQFMVLSLTCGEAFHHHPILAPTWALVAGQKQGLAAVMETWGDEVWQALQAHHEALP
jgi:hypothetical protein